MKIVLFADNAVGLGITQYLLDNYYEDILMVVSIGQNKIFSLAQAHGIQTHIYENEKKLKLAMPNYFDLGVLAWWPHILKFPILKLADNGFINTHPSKLPYNKGKHYNFWALVEEVPFGVTIHQVEEGVDTGHILAQEEISYNWCDTGQTLYYLAQKKMLELFEQVYPKIRNNEVIPKPQPNDIGSFHYASEIDNVSKIDLEKEYKARDLLNVIRARTFEGHPGSWFEEEGQEYEISINIRKKNDATR